jgi:hypothetical protein
VAGPLATAYVAIRANFSGFATELEGGLATAGARSAAAGEKAGQNFGTGFGSQLRKGLPAWASAGTQAGSTFGSRFGSSVGKITAALAKVGMAAYAAGTAYAVVQAMKLEDAQVRLATAVKNSGGNLTGFSRQLDTVRARMESWGFTNAEVDTSLATLITATGSVADAIGAESTAANLARFRHMDLASASDMLAKSFAGNMRSMKGLGLTIATGATSAAAMKKAVADLNDQVAAEGGMAQFAAAHHLSLAKAQDLVHAAAKGSIPAMNQLGLVVLPASASAAQRYAQITGTLNARIGGQAAAAAGTAAGKFGILKAQFTDLAAQVGAKVLPKIIGFLDWMQKTHALIPALVTVMGILTAAILVQAAAWAMTPIGMITLAIVALIAIVIALKTHWKTVWTFCYNLVVTVWNKIVDGIKAYVNVILNVLGWIITGAAKAFGWIPGLGPKLRTAARAFGTFRDNVNAALDGLKGKTVNVGVRMTAANNPYPGGISGRAATGGQVYGPGSGTSDTAGVFALSRGEWVVKAAAAAKYGPKAMASVNRGTAVIIPGMAAGGQVGQGVQVRADLPAQSVISAQVNAAVLALAKKFAAGMASAFGGSTAIVRDAMQWIGKIPYVWGGTAVPGGADCSGFVQAIYGRHGISAPRTSEAQGAWVRRTGPIPGGLAFYNSPAGGPPPGHVAIVGDRGMVISQGGGMGPQYVPLNSMPLMFTGVPPAMTSASNPYPGGISGRMAAGGAVRSYDSGGWLPPGVSMAVNRTGQPERVTAPGGGTDSALLAAILATLQRHPALIGAAVADGVNGIGRGMRQAVYR